MNSFKKGIVVVTNKNLPIHIRHIIELNDKYDEVDFKKSYYDMFSEINGDEFTCFYDREDYQKFIEFVKTELTIFYSLPDEALHKIYESICEYEKGIISSELNKYLKEISSANYGMKQDAIFEYLKDEYTKEITNRYFRNVKTKE